MERNPFDSAQREGRERTVKWCLWECLAKHYPENGARVADLQRDERLLELRPKMRAAKNLNGQITGELGSDKGVHFIKDFNGQPGYWGVRLGAASAAEQPAAGERPAGGGAAEAAQPLQDPQQQQADQRQQQHPGAPPKQAAQGHRAAMPSPPVPGNDSEAAPWAGATCQYLTDRLWKRGVAVWWPAEQQYFSGKIMETLSEEGADLLLLHVLYDDQTDEWMRPTRFKVSGGKDHTVVVITENEVYIRDEASGRLVPDPNQGVDPAALGGPEAAGASAAAEAASRTPVAAGQQQGAQQQAAPPQQTQQQAQQQEPVKSATSRSSEARSGRKPHAARAPGDIPSKGSWWQKAVVDEARALEIQKQRSSASEEHPQSPAAAAGGAQQAQQESQRQEGQQQQQAQQESQRQQQTQAQAQAGSVQAEQPPAAQQGQQERKRKLPAEEAAAERPQHGRPQQAQQVQQARQQPGQRPHEQAPAEKRQRRESSAGEQAPQQRRQAQGGEKPAIPQSSSPVAAKLFTIPKRAQTEQARPPPPKQPAAGLADGSKAKGLGGSMPFRIPKAAAAPSAAAPAAAGAAPAERQGGKRPHESAEGAADQRRPPQPQGWAEAERGQRAQQQQQQLQQQQHAPPPQQPQQPHAQQHAQQQRQPRGRSPEAVRREERDTRELILRHCQADAYRRMGQVRWATHADRAELPEPRRDPGAAAAVAALLAPHKMALSERLAANGPWPHGTALLPEPGSAAAGAGRGTLAGAPAQPPEDAQFGRIFVCKRNTTSACFKRNVFVSNSDIDLHGLHPGSLALLHSLDEKLVYGWFRVVELGTNLDPGFPAEAAFKYHVRVQPLHLFQPVPDTLLDMFVERKTHPKTGKRMKFFDRHLDARQCRQIWSLMHFYNEKLHDSWDCLWRLSPLTPAGAGFYDALARQEAARTGGGGGSSKQHDRAALDAA